MDNNYFVLRNTIVIQFVWKDTIYTLFIYKVTFKSVHIRIQNSYVGVSLTESHHLRAM